MASLFKENWTKVGIWLLAEILLNCTGFDQLADYSEFLWHSDINALDRYSFPSVIEKLLTKTSL